MDVFLIYTLVGLLAGFVGGLFGVGGGVVIVPLLLLSFASQGIDQSIATHMAIGTSLAVIVAISANSALAHHRHSAVEWGLFRHLAPGVAVGAVVGSLLAAQLSGTTLQIAFGVLLVLLGLQAGFGLQPDTGRPLPGRVALFSVGGVIGSLSALFGIGGGSLTTPFLLWRNVPIRRAIATSAACGLPIGMFSAVTYSLGGNSELMPEWCVGYVYLPALFGVAVFSLLSVRFGASLAHRLPERHMKQLFAILSVILGGRFIWVNL